MKNVQIKSYCKINLYLKILKKLDNGYHKIASFVTFCDLHDVIKINRAKNNKDKIIFSGKFKKNISENLNTITKLLYQLRKRNYLKKENFVINVKKNIPHGSGLGGGSSNAAALLNFFNIKMNLGINKRKLIKISESIGFDVPLCLEKKNTFLIGPKNKFVRIKKKFKFNILIIYPNFICSTKNIYKQNRKFSQVNLKLKYIVKNRKKMINQLKNEQNDLENAVVKLYPQVKNIINFIKIQNGCYFSRITGAGSACIGIFSSKKSALYAQKVINLKFPKYWSIVSKTI